MVFGVEQWLSIYQVVEYCPCTEHVADALELHWLVVSNLKDLRGDIARSTTANKQWRSFNDFCG